MPCWSQLLSIKFDKAHTRADWRNGIPEAQIEYAADDVIYLCQIYQIMVKN